MAVAGSVAGLLPDQARFVKTLHHAEDDVDQALKLDQIASPEIDTCHWITSNPTLINEEQGVSTRFLWISESPGSGKLVIFKYIINNLQQFATVVPEGLDLRIRSKICRSHGFCVL